MWTKSLDPCQSLPRICLTRLEERKIPDNELELTVNVYVGHLLLLLYVYTYTCRIRERFSKEKYVSTKKNLLLIRVATIFECLFISKGFNFSNLWELLGDWNTLVIVGNVLRRATNCYGTATRLRSATYENIYWLILEMNIINIINLARPVRASKSDFQHILYHSLLQITGPNIYLPYRKYSYLTIMSLWYFHKCIKIELTDNSNALTGFCSLSWLSRISFYWKSTALPILHKRYKRYLIFHNIF